ncbi:MAG: translational GTPase TypA [Candidatus Saccharibacteria bacterium]|nr:translational GTPase TypA [Candidatus Saccharibacteria bacterium]
MTNIEKIRNIAIIAHVDHGKTTLVDGLLKQSHMFRDNQAEMTQNLIMDSGDQEKERGITITAKITAVDWNGYRINIIDTPGHADFSGEVERTLSMADGCLLIVDAQEGPMPQTKFVLSKALALGLQPIVVINKVDKSAARLGEVETELDDLFLDLAVHESQLHYKTYYATGREGKSWAIKPDDITSDADLTPIFEAIVEHIEPPRVEPDKPFQMLVSSLRWDSFQGKYAVGRIQRGNIAKNTKVVLCKKDGTQAVTKVERIYRAVGLESFEIDNASAGDIVSLTGISAAQIGETVADAEQPEALPVLEIEAPTLKIYLGSNTSPFKGKEGEFTTSRQIGERLQKELETNIGLKVAEEGIGYLVSGRGELHLGVLIETMRREGYEFEVGRPQVVTQMLEGVEKEPVEEVIIEVPAEHVGAVQTELGKRRGDMTEQFASPKGVTKLVYKLPTRALLGLRNILITATRGTIVMNTLVVGYEPVGQSLQQLRSGVLIAWEQGVTTPYALQTAEERGICFVGPATSVYAGQIIGLNSRGDDLEVNVCKEKHLTNMRSKSSDGVVQLVPPVTMSLEQCLDFLENDELLEVTPKSLRLRKRELDHNKRKRLVK